MQHLRNDIAVLTLARPVALSDKVSTVCLPQGGQQVTAGTKCYITGIQAANQLTKALKSKIIGSLYCVLKGLYSI